MNNGTFVPLTLLYKTLYLSVSHYKSPDDGEFNNTAFLYSNKNEAKSKVAAFEVNLLFAIHTFKNFASPREASEAATTLCGLLRLVCPLEMPRFHNTFGKLPCESYHITCDLLSCVSMGEVEDFTPDADVSLT